MKPQPAIRCPNTRLLISIHMNMTPAQFDSCTFVDNTVGCPRCGEAHKWSSADVVFAKWHVK